MITIGIDPHKQTHTAVAVNEVGQLLGEITISGDETGQQDLLNWVQALEGAEKHRFALEDCRHVNGGLERFLLASDEEVLRVPPSLMAGARKSARTRGKSDAIDALAIARAARSLDQASVRRSLSQRLARREQSVQVRICRDLLARIGDLTRRERQLASEIGERAKSYCPVLFEVPGVASLTAGKLIGEIAGIGRFASDAQLAHFAGCAPIPASSGKTERYRFDRHGNRQLNAAFYRIALTQARVHPGARAYLAKKRAEGKSTAEALRCLKRLLVRVVWRTLRTACEPSVSPSPI